jgi:hypothetical protein
MNSLQFFDWGIKGKLNIVVFAFEGIEEDIQMIFPTIKFIRETTGGIYVNHTNSDIKIEKLAKNTWKMNFLTGFEGYFMYDSNFASVYWNFDCSNPNIKEIFDKYECLNWTRNTKLDWGYEHLLSMPYEHSTFYRNNSPVNLIDSLEKNKLYKYYYPFKFKKK